MDKKTEAASLAAKLPAEKLESVLRYMRILVRMKGTRSPEAEARGEENVSFTISEDGKAGAFFDDGDYVFEEPNEGDYLPGITAADVNQAE